MRTIDFIVLISVCLISNLCDPLVVPLLPLQLADHDISEAIFGYIFAINPAASMFGALFVAKLMNAYGRKTILMLGICTLGLALILFSCISFIEDSNTAVAFCLLSRACQGFSISMIQTTAFAVISVMFKEQKQTYFSYLEGAQGLGMVAGPAVGGVLYVTVGFRGTFYSLGGFLLIMLPVVYYKLPELTDDQETPLLHQSSARSDQESNQSSISVRSSMALNEASYLGLLCNTVFFLTTATVVLSTLQFAYFLPVIPIELKRYNLSDLQVCLFMSLNSIGYLLCTLLFLPLLSRAINNRVIIAWSLFLGGCNHLLIGPSKPIPHNFILMMIGQVLVGIFLISLMIPSLVVMIENAEERFPAKKASVNNLSSGIFNFCVKFGQTFGALYASHLSEVLGFRNVCTTVALTMILFCSIYTLICASKFIALTKDQFSLPDIPEEPSKNTPKLKIVTPKSSFIPEEFSLPTQISVIPNHTTYESTMSTTQNIPNKNTLFSI
ncbi:unnamed protein product [Moneuplotes crassus]|uniref:Major facilitator superfamily (MFS) profile domain-containing protein n=1 Tax=Euplotes crassus TaxID=5936 RepID=A0AAD1XAN5_EUPCR|nr:unnamed protein product [Moneuplotes crassus]